jgi:hypothetical protein
MEYKIHILNGLANRGRIRDISANDLDVKIPECRNTARAANQSPNSNSLLQEGLNNMPTDKSCPAGHQGTQRIRLLLSLKADWEREDASRLT